ncbi:DUF6193 family natural product biosynthesis protein [Streptomyces adelaidensis]|jgi:hypothetical protein|uniref:DUF6193 family natural product biosynthesis protein n=1 Tax=Streptomyces adelaidensis TaxID=2796465 RepID=UPI0019034D75|nr:DUF6193 family natural product biosynthesis protein [Streptomyces adelaidensis]
MSRAPDIATAWLWLRARKSGTRGATHDGLPAVVEAAHAEPRLRALYPFPTHGTLAFLRCAPPPWPGPGRGLPFILYGGPPYEVYSAGYAELLGEVATPAEAAALVVSHLPADATVQRDA